MFGWLIREHTKHLLSEVEWLRAELRFERDRNGRLQEQFLTLQVGAPIGATAPAMPRESNTERELASLNAMAREIDNARIGELPE